MKGTLISVLTIAALVVSVSGVFAGERAGEQEPTLVQAQEGAPEQERGNCDRTRDTAERNQTF